MATLANKVALVTGSASGIGAAIVRRFVAEGARVVGSDIQTERGQRLAEETGTRFLPHDVSDAAGWQAVIDDITRREGRLDILINNAGIVGGGPVDSCSAEAWHKVINVNLTGTFFGCQHAVTVMKDNPGSKGAIVNVSSINGFTGLAGDVAYTASKGGVRLLTKSVAVYCAQNKWAIRCNSLHPGAIDTPILDPAKAALPQFEEIVSRMSPWHRMGSPDEMAGAALFLVSDDASFMTGTELLADGGALAATPGL